MYALSLTSIPPRFARLAPVLTALLAQRPRAIEVFLTLPRHYIRFPGPVTPPDLPKGVTLLWHNTDLGPATKALPAARHLAGTGLRLVYCDDDWIYPPHWAQSLLKQNDVAVTGQAWDSARLGRKGTGVDDAQGFPGVSVCPNWLAGSDTYPPKHAIAADDIWLSGQLARQNIALRTAPEARNGMILAFNDDHALQDATLRNTANRVCAAEIHARYGIWPPA